MAHPVKVKVELEFEFQFPHIEGNAEIGKELAECFVEGMRLSLLYDLLTAETKLTFKEELPQTPENKQQALLHKNKIRELKEELKLVTNTIKNAKYEVTT